MLVCLFVGVFGLFFARMATDYGREYNASEWELYNQSVALNTQVEDINTQLNNTGNPDSDATSFVSAFLSSGWTVLKTTFKSFGIFNTLADDTLEKANLGAGTSHFKTYLLMIAAVIFFLMAVSVIVGRDLI